jgi:hypothetical protein
MALLQLVKKALLLLNMVLMLLLNMAGNGIAADIKKGITSAKDSAEVYNPRFCLARTVFICLSQVIIKRRKNYIFCPAPPYVEDVCHPLSR